MLKPFVLTRLGVVQASDSEPQHADIHDDRVIGDFWHAKLDGFVKL